MAKAMLLFATMMYELKVVPFKVTHCLRIGLVLGAATRMNELKLVPFKVTTT